MPLLNLTTSGIIERIQLHLPKRRYTRENTSLLYHVLSGVAAIYKPIADYLDEVLTYTQIGTATGVYLDDIIERISGIKREDDEDDADYLDRYYRFIFEYNISPTGVINIVTDYLGYEPDRLIESDFDESAFYNTGFYVNDPQTTYAPEIPDAFVGYIYFSSEPDTTVLSSLARALEFVRMAGTKIYLIWPYFGDRLYSSFERMYLADDLVMNFSYPGSSGEVINYSSVQEGISFTDTNNYYSRTSGQLESSVRLQTSGSTSLTTGYPTDFLFTINSPRLQYTRIENYAPLTRREILVCNTGSIIFTVDTVYDGVYGLRPLSITRTKSGPGKYYVATGLGLTSLTGSSFWNIENAHDLKILTTYDASGIQTSLTGTSSGIVSGQYFVENFIGVNFARTTYSSGGTSIFAQTGNIKTLGLFVYDQSPKVTLTNTYLTGSSSGYISTSTGTNQSVGNVSGLITYNRNSTGLVTGIIYSFNCPTGLALSGYFWQPPYIMDISPNREIQVTQIPTETEYHFEQDGLSQLISFTETNTFDSNGRLTSFQRS